MMDSAHQEEFVRLFAQAQSALRGYALALSGSFRDSDDLVQEVAVILLRKFAEYDRQQPFVRWALGVARNVVLKSRRNYARHPLCFDSDLVASIGQRYAALAPELDARASHLRGHAGIRQSP